jgi:uncharacterized membrane protein
MSITTVIFGMFAFLLGWLSLFGLLTGVVSRTAGLHAARKTEPLAYWAFVLAWGLLALLAAWVALQASQIN